MDSALGQIAAMTPSLFTAKAEPRGGKFQVILAAGGLEKALDVTADVGLPPLAVVPVRPLPRAWISTDVEVQRAG